MMQNNDFTVPELFEKAKADPSWEADENLRKRLADGLLRSLINNLS